jgi:hypothetical protein
MRDGTHGVNSITIGTTELLLTDAGGTAVHLTPEAGEGTGQAAVPEEDFHPEALRRSSALANYDRDALLAARWAPTTLCGRDWIVMVGGDGGSINPFDEDPAFAPTCKRCLFLMDRMFAPPPVHPQLPLVAQVIANLVAEHGYAELHGVPGDQQTELRRQIRSLVRKGTRHTCRTFVHGSMIVVVCEPIAELHHEEQLADAAEAMEAYLRGEPRTPRPDPEWRLRWSTLATD